MTAGSSDSGHDIFQRLFSIDPDQKIIRRLRRLRRRKCERVRLSCAKVWPPGARAPSLSVLMNPCNLRNLRMVDLADRRGPKRASVLTCSIILAVSGDLSPLANKSPLLYARPREIPGHARDWRREIPAIPIASFPAVRPVRAARGPFRR